ncbi:MAG: PAS domain-containing protein, partial [Candidatus Omnitrophica bacterium]|nr:PAS domain-containing protein [Candidatus Omnitrophota bacterium]
MRKSNVADLQSSFNLENVIDGMKNGFYIADNNSNISYANEAFAKILRYSRKEDVIGL